MAVLCVVYARVWMSILLILLLLIRMSKSLEGGYADGGVLSRRE